MKTIALLFATLGTTGAMLFAQAPAATLDYDALAAGVERDVEHAMLAADPTGHKGFAEAAAIDALAKPLDEALVQAPKHPALLYTKAFSIFAASVPLRWANNRGGVAERYERAAALLDKVHGGRWEKEATAFEGYLLTLLIGLQSDRAMDLWPKADRLISRAGKELPHGPRALFFRGFVLWTVPADMGGDTDKGLALMRAAGDAFAGEESAPPADAGPHWGYGYVLAWVGSGLKKKGDFAGAGETWKHTLQIAPEYVFVEQKLLPSLVKKPAKPAKPAAKA